MLEKHAIARQTFMNSNKKRKNMAEAVSKNKRKYFYGLLDIDGNIEKIYKNVNEIRIDFPKVIYSCIFSVCNGSKKTHLNRK
jgi:hypothetical protein